jgi:hypothetical protein
MFNKFSVVTGGRFSGERVENLFTGFADNDGVSRADNDGVSRLFMT